jgi:hypothetical protein
MRKIKINCQFNIETRSYKYVIVDKKTKTVILNGYYKSVDYIHKTTGDIGKEIYNNNAEWLNNRGYTI